MERNCCGAAQTLARTQAPYMSLVTSVRSIQNSFRLTLCAGRWSGAPWSLPMVNEPAGTNTCSMLSTLERRVAPATGSGDGLGPGVLVAGGSIAAATVTAAKGAGGGGVLGAGGARPAPRGAAPPPGGGGRGRGG